MTPEEKQILSSILITLNDNVMANRRAIADIARQNPQMINKIDDDKRIIEDLIQRFRNI